jgi:hypothetical protein
MLSMTCPACGEQGVWVRGDRAGVDVDCLNGCTTDIVLGALAERVRGMGAA